MWTCNYNKVFLHLGLNGMRLKNVIPVCPKICPSMIRYIQSNKIASRVNHRATFILANKITAATILAYVNFPFYRRTCLTVVFRVVKKLMVNSMF